MARHDKFKIHFPSFLAFWVQSRVRAGIVGDFMKRWIEFLILYAVVPSLCIFRIIPFQIVAMLALCCTFCVIVLLNDRTFDRSLLRLRIPPARQFLPLVLPYLATGCVLIVCTWFFHRETFFWLPRKAPLFWLVIITLYPVISVAPQEVIYRVYFFHRFGKSFSTPAIANFVCAGIFGLHHWVFHNWLAVALTLAGGLKFALTYRRTHSLFTVCVEHAFYGGMLFTIGLGMYFFSGTYQFASMLLPHHP
jgi:membrane protease YdiL (CAAX protease family)